MNAYSGLPRTKCVKGGENTKSLIHSQRHLTRGRMQPKNKKLHDTNTLKRVSPPIMKTKTKRYLTRRQPNKENQLNFFYNIKRIGDRIFEDMIVPILPYFPCTC